MITYICTDFAVWDITQDEAADICTELDALVSDGMNPILMSHCFRIVNEGVFRLYYPATADPVLVEKFFFKLKLKYSSLDIQKKIHPYTLHG